MVLSITIAHTQIDDANSPSMTVFTIQWACMNRANSERSEEVSGSADCATSAGFMRLQSFRLTGSLKLEPGARSPDSTWADMAAPQKDARPNPQCAKTRPPRRYAFTR